MAKMNGYQNRIRLMNCSLYIRSPIPHNTSCKKIYLTKFFIGYLIYRKGAKWYILGNLGKKLTGREEL